MSLRSYLKPSDSKPLLPDPIKVAVMETVAANARVAESRDAEAGRKCRQSYHHYDPNTNASLATVEAEAGRMRRQLTITMISTLKQTLPDMQQKMATKLLL